MDELTEVKHITLYPNDIAIVAEVAAMYSQSFSGGLRIIIRDWARYNAPKTQTEEPTNVQS